MMTNPFIRDICRIFGHDEFIQGLECGSVCKRCNEYVNDVDVLSEEKFIRKMGRRWLGAGLPDKDYKHPCCAGCIARHMRRAVREGRASIRPGCEHVFSEKYFGVG